MITLVFNSVKRSVTDLFFPVIQDFSTVDIPLLREVVETPMEKRFSFLADGTQIPRAYQPDHLEEKRLKALNWLGKKWLHHPFNKIERGCYEEVSVAVLQRKDFFLVNHFDKIRGSHLIAQAVQ